jgi:long-chain acyl-CoA synthetase
MTTTLTHTSNDRTVPEGTLVDLFFDGVARHGERTTLEYMRRGGELEGQTYHEVFGLTKNVAASLEAHGVTRGDRAAILSENRPEWAVADYGCLCAGVIDVPIYSTLTAPQVAYILKDSGAKLVFASTTAQMEKTLKAAAECGHAVQVVVFEPKAEVPDGVVTWADFLADGSGAGESWTDEEFETRARQAEPSDVATVLYTSGTTGDPKGVMLTHNNVSSNVRAACMVLAIGADDNTISFLPLCHILQRMVDYLFFWTGCRIGYPQSLQTVVGDMKIIKPTVVVSVPRIYEKIYNGVMDASGVKKKLIDWAVGVAERVAGRRLEGQKPGPLLALQYGLADKLVFSKVKNAVGGRLRFFVSGGGPLAPTLNRFFYSIGMTILEGYGLTETSPVTNVNTLEDFRIGAVGLAVPGTEIRIAQDGEILVRGPQVMKGYYNKPEATAASMDADGWFSTGDIGEIDADGFLKITDRKKDIIVTAGGKNVAPQPIENRLKTNRFIEQAVMVGDKRRYCSMLIVPAFGPLESWAKANGVSWSDRKELVADAAVLKHVQAEMKGMLKELASFETPKKIALLDEELTIENGFLTPTLKVKRRVVYEQLGAVIDGLYADEAVDGAS